MRVSVMTDSEMGPGKLFLKHTPSLPKELFQENTSLLTLLVSFHHLSLYFCTQNFFVYQYFSSISFLAVHYHYYFVTATAGRQRVITRILDRDVKLDLHKSRPGSSKPDQLVPRANFLIHVSVSYLLQFALGWNFGVNMFL